MWGETGAGFADNRMLLQTDLGSLLSTNRYWTHKHTQSVDFQGGDLQIIIQHFLSFSIATFSFHPPPILPFLWQTDTLTHTVFLFLLSLTHTHTHTHHHHVILTLQTASLKTDYVNHDNEKYQHLSLNDVILIFLWKMKPHIRNNLRSSDM